MDSNNHRYSIKNLLFTKAIPNYKIPVPTAGWKIYPCTDCGDKFILEQSYEYHVNRKSVKISYFCRPCDQVMTFYNRCNFLSHIRTHTFKTATINVSDLKLEPLPLTFFDNICVTNTANYQSKKANCPECQCSLGSQKDTLCQIRADHYMKLTKVFTCPICLYALPSECALKSHFRFHLQLPPYFCPQCGAVISSNTINSSQPFNHSCEGFKTMRAAMRLKCPAAECHLIHPSEYIDHVKSTHMHRVFKCPFCVVACHVEAIMEKHLRKHEQTSAKALVFFQCDMCPSRLVVKNQIVNHMMGHRMDLSYMYPCWSCGKVFQHVKELIAHHTKSHNLPADIKQAFDYVCNGVCNIPKLKTFENAKEKNIYRVVKKCDQCARSFTYKCSYDQIQFLPNDCPYKCTSSEPLPQNQKIKCPLCDDTITQNWEEIKNHFNSKGHTSHKCIDIQCVIPKINITKYIKSSKKSSLMKAKTRNVSTNKKNKRKRNPINKVDINKITNAKSLANTSNLNIKSDLLCKKCGHEFESKELLGSHLLSHRDPCMAYQCMECGECFVVKPSFSTHLLLEHNITDVEDYIVQKQCYNENALLKYQDSCVTNEPLRENQCGICRDQFENSSDLKKHFRVHGMAFLLKNNNIKSP